MTSKKRLILSYGILALLLAVLFAANLFWGSVSLTPGAVLAALTGRGQDALSVGIITQLRLPRAVMVVLLGAALSAAGYLLQTFFANPIAGPFVMGISSGAKLAVALVMVAFSEPGPAHQLPYPDHSRLCGGHGLHGLCAGGFPAGAADEHPCHLRRNDRLHLFGRHGVCGGLCPGQQHRQPP